MPPFFFAFLMILPAIFFHPEKSDGPCVKSFKETWKFFHQAYEGDDENSGPHYLKYRINTTMKPGSKYRSSKITAEMIVKGNLMRFESDRMKLYRDTLKRISVIPGKKLIHISDAYSQKQVKMKRHQLHKTYQTLIRDNPVKSCRNASGPNQKRITFAINEAPRQYAKVEELKAYFTPSTKSLDKMIMYFSKESKVKTMKISYKKVDHEYDGPFQLGSMNNFVFDQSGDLLPKYKSYQVIDARK